MEGREAEASFYLLQRELYRGSVPIISPQTDHPPCPHMITLAAWAPHKRNGGTPLLAALSVAIRFFLKINEMAQSLTLGVIPCLQVNLK